MAKWMIFFKKYKMALLPGLVLVAVAINQMRLKTTHYLSPWKGGGFGMFSDITLRYSHLHLINSQTFYCAEKPNLYRKSILKLHHYPNHIGLAQLGKSLIQHPWVVSPHGVVSMANPKRPNNTWKPLDFNSIDIQIFDIEFYKASGQVTPKLIRKISAFK
jgi:hypothetical protein